MLDALVHPEVFLGIATGKNRRGLDRVLQRHGLAPRFHNFKTADDGPGKPHPHLLQAAMAEVGAEPAQTVMVGDTRSEEHTSELQSLMRNSYAVFCLQKTKHKRYNNCTPIYYWFSN